MQNLAVCLPFLVFLAFPQLATAQDIIDGVCVAFCEDYVPPPSDDDTIVEDDFYTTPRGHGWFCEARAPDGSWGWGESPSKSNARNYALSECGRHARNCSITFCRQGGGKGYSPNRKTGKPNTGKGKLKPSISQQKKIREQKQLSEWRRRATAENKKCLAAFDESYWTDDSVSTLMRHCAAALEYCRKGRAGCKVHTWNLNRAETIKAEHEKRFSDAVRLYDAALDLCGHDDDCANVGNFKQLAGMRSNLLSKRETAEGKAELMRQAEASEGRIADAARSSQDTSASPTSSGLNFMDPVAVVPSAKANYLLDALQSGDGDWDKSIRDLEAVLEIDPDNRSARDALIYLHGLHKGQLAVSKLNNVRYRQGVDAWMNGDYKAAARHLGESYAADPSDYGSLEAYGLVSGLAQTEAYLDWSRDCGAINCPPPDPLAYPKEFASILNSPAYRLLDETDRRKLADIQGMPGKSGASLEQEAALHYVEGLGAWDDFRQRVLEQAEKTENTDSMVDAYIRLANGDYDGALDILGAISWDDDAATFAYFHARGLAKGYDSTPSFLTSGDNETRLEAVWRDLQETRLAAENLNRHDPELRPPWQVIGERLRAEERDAWAEFLTDPFAAGADLAGSPR
ncbi:tetratricopeptide repeat protein [Roseibium sp. Sym1]|uniref:tetratricopeptide repeat protein n=1 Tax=Roseibium sp. Sym1 TaxID=3016006 RepID=UPI0022B585E1|nr:hypothetical protein [Roseibium sp. Sym1]